MCSIAAIGLVLSVGGSIMQGVQQKQMADYQAKAYDQQANAEAQASAFEAAQERKKQDMMQAAARAQVGASGVAVQGSPSEALVSNAEQGQLELKAIEYGSQLRQNNLRTQGDIERFSGNQKMAAGFVSGLTNLFDPNRASYFGGSVFAKK